jgi:hypothetical protein
MYIHVLFLSLLPKFYSDQHFQNNKGFQSKPFSKRIGKGNNVLWPVEIMVINENDRLYFIKNNSL